MTRELFLSNSQIKKRREKKRGNPTDCPSLRNKRGEDRVEGRRGRKRRPLLRQISFDGWRHDRKHCCPSPL